MKLLDQKPIKTQHYLISLHNIDDVQGRHVKKGDIVNRRTIPVVKKPLEILIQIIFVFLQEINN